MTPDLSVYVNFDGRARQALTFYESVFGGTLEFEEYSAYGIGEPGEGDKIIYGVLHSPDGFVIRGTDKARHDGPVEPGNRYHLCLNGDDATLLQRCWDRLAARSDVIAPQTVTPWGDRNGVLRDEFGITWIVNIGSSS